MAARKVLTQPEEGMFHIYPVLNIPTGKEGELLIIGLPKARAVIKHYAAILKFVQKYEENLENGS